MGFHASSNVLEMIDVKKLIDKCFEKLLVFRFLHVPSECCIVLPSIIREKNYYE